MALINDIIKRYEQQAEVQAMHRQQASPEFKSNRDDIFLKVEKRGDPIGEDTAIGLGRGRIWKAQAVNINKPAKLLTEEEIQAQKDPLELEVENLRKENTELKQKLAELNVNYA